MLGAFDRARDMTRRLLNFGKGASAPRQIVSVKAIIEESCNLSLRGSNTEFSLCFSEPLLSVHANATELSEVFCNIVLNARQAMKDAGRLCVTATNRTVAEANEEQLQPGEYVLVEIQDSGPGIDAAVQQRIFEPFFTSKRDGSGLGLAMSRAIVGGYGGHVAVVSSLGEGATFRVWLPATGRATARQAPESIRGTGHGSGRILVLDDDEVICRIAALQLAKQGYEVETSTDGEQAIELYRRSRANGQPFDLLILDLTVRHGMGGVETLTKLRQEDPAVVALACSGLTDEAALAEVKACGFAGLLAKPFLAHELASMVRAAMATEAQSASSRSAS
jgi:CheY-like chemotaxis protein